MWFEIITILILNLICIGGSLLLGFYQRYAKYSLTYVNNAWSIITPPTNLIHPRDIQNVYMSLASSAHLQIMGAFLFNFVSLYWIYKGYQTNTPLSSIIIVILLLTNANMLYIIHSSYRYFKLLADRLKQMHSFLFEVYAQDEELGVLDEVEHKKLREFLDYYTPWLGGVSNFIEIKIPYG